MSIKKKYDPTFARMIGNIAAGLAGRVHVQTKEQRQEIANTAFDIAKRSLKLAKGEGRKP